MMSSNSQVLLFSRESLELKLGEPAEKRSRFVGINEVGLW